MVQSNLLKRLKNVNHAFYSQHDTLQVSSLFQRPHASAQQIHGNSVVVVSSPGNYPLVDGIVTTSRLSAIIRTADCLPVLLSSSKITIVSAVHAGWRGLHTGVVKEAISLMCSYGASTDTLFVGIGPHIRRCCYEVPIERVKLFLSQGYPEREISDTMSGRTMLNMSAIIHEQLMRYGVQDHNIDISPICTCCDTTFASYRRAPIGAQRNISYISLL